MRAVRAVLDEHGRPLKTFKVQVEQAAPPAAVYQLDRMLTLVTTRGTGRGAAARLPQGIVVAGKTGTSSDTRDSWFAGFTGSYVAVAWVGYDDNRATGLTGAAGALPVWADTMARLKPASFQPVPPESVEDRWIGYGDGLETAPACSADAVLVAVPEGHVIAGETRLRFVRGERKPPAAPAPRQLRPWVRKSRHGSRTSFIERAGRRVAAIVLLGGCSLLSPRPASPSAPPAEPRSSAPQFPGPAPGPASSPPPAPPPAAARAAAARKPPLARHSLAGDAGARADVAGRS